MYGQVNRIHLENLKRVSYACSFFCLVTGLAVLMSWNTQLPFFLMIFDHLPLMTPNVALGIILIGLTICFNLLIRSKKGRLALDVAVGLFLLVLGICALIERFFIHEPLKLNQWFTYLFILKEAIEYYPPKLLPAPNSAITFILIGIGLILFNIKRVFSEIFLLLALTLPMLGIIGHAFQLSALYVMVLSHGIQSGMSLYAALCFIVGILGLIGVRPQNGILSRSLVSSPVGEILRKMLLGFLLIPFIFSASAIVEAQGWITNSALIHGLTSILILMVLLILTSASVRSIVVLENEQLDIMTKLNEAVKKREDLLAVVSHDLNNPLTAMDLATKMVKQATLGKFKDPRLSKALKTHESAITQMRKLIKILLDLGKLQSGTFSPEYNLTSVAQIFKSLQSTFEPMAANKKLDLNFSLDDGIDFIECDEDRIYQVLSNLIGNSIKFTNPGGKISVDGWISDRKTRMVLQVRDNGMGITKEQKEHIFDRYWQPSSTKHQGTGLGLFIAKGIVEAHRGNIEVLSEPGVGTIFRFTLPVKNEFNDWEQST